MNIGYACLTRGVPGIEYRTSLQKNASETVLLDLIGHNLNALENAIRYNIRSGIRLFRISSDLIPFGSSPVNQLNWSDIFAADWQRIGKLIRDGGQRVSMHPGQYTVLNSPRDEVVARAVDDLIYHARVLDCLELDNSHKIILHIGGQYGDKPAAIERFCANSQQLPADIRQRLVIENDDRSYTIDDVFEIGKKMAIPVVFDNLHHLLNHRPGELNMVTWINRCQSLWQKADGAQKMHYSQQDTAKKGGSHSQTIAVQEFVDFCHSLARKDLDIMLEVKDKNLSARKCLICIDDKPSIKALEEEWAKYKYKVLERSPADYLAIRELLKDKTGEIRLAFYSLIEHALEVIPTAGQVENAAMHVWGYFKNQITEQEKKRFLISLDRFRAGLSTIQSVKSQLQKLAVKYEENYLIESYYFLD